MKPMRFIICIIILAVGAAAFFASRRMIVAQESKPGDPVVSETRDAVDVESTAVRTNSINQVTAPAESDVLPARTSNLSAPQQGKTQVATADWLAVVKVVLVFQGDTTRRAIEGVMFRAGTDTWVVTAGLANRAPKDVPNAIERVLIERADREAFVNATMEAETVRSDVPDLNFYRLPDFHTEFRLTTKIPSQDQLKIAVGDVLAGQNIRFQRQQHPLRLTTRVTVSDVNRSIAFKLENGPTMRLEHLIELDGVLVEGTPIFKDDKLAGIVVAGVRYANDGKHSFAIPINRIREGCRRAFVMDTTERALESADATPEPADFREKDEGSTPAVSSDLGRPSSVSKENSVPAFDDTPKLPEPFEAEGIPTADAVAKRAAGSPVIPSVSADEVGSPPVRPALADESKTAGPIENITTDTLLPATTEAQSTEVAADSQDAFRAPADAGAIPEGPPLNAPAIGKSVDEVVADSPESLNDDRPFLKTLAGPNSAEGISVDAEGPATGTPILPSSTEETKLQPAENPTPPNSATMKRAREVITLKHLDPDDTAKTLSALFGDVVDGHGEVRIAPNSSSHTIIISAPQSEIDDISQTVAKLEQLAVLSEAESRKNAVKRYLSPENYQKWLAKNGHQPDQPAVPQSQAVGPFLSGVLTQPNQQDVALDLESTELAMQVRTAQGPDRDKLRTQLEELTSKHFDLRQQIRLQEIDDLARRVEQMRAAHTRRTEQKANIIKRRLAELLEDDADLKWNGEQHGAAAATGKTAPTEDPDGNPGRN